MTSSAATQGITIWKMGERVRLKTGICRPMISFGPTEVDSQTLTSGRTGNEKTMAMGAKRFDLQHLSDAYIWLPGLAIALRSICLSFHA